MNPLATAALASRVWGRKTLAALHSAALTEANGNAFDALREKGGTRLVVVMCMSQPDQIARIEEFAEFEDGLEEEDWQTLTLAELAGRAAAAAAPVCEALHDAKGRKTALCLIAADPCSVTMMEALFELPR